MLTAKQEKFVRNLIQGMSQREAYKRSYDAENMLDTSIDVEACKLFNNPKVAQRYEELQNRLANKAIMSAEERLEFLTRIVLGTELEQIVGIVEGEEVGYERMPDLGTRMKAVDIMNKMTGEYVTKLEGSVSVKLEDLL